MLLRVRALVSVIVIFVPLALTVPKSFVALPSVIFPAVPEPELVKFAVPVETFAAPVCVIAPPALTVRPFAVIVPSTTAFVSTMVRFVPQAVMVPKSFVLLFRVILPAVPVPDETKFAAPLMVATPNCEMAPPEVTVRFDDVVVPSVTASVSVMVIFVPLAMTVPKLFVELPNRISPVATRLAVPLTQAGPVCVSVPVVLIVKFGVVSAGKVRQEPVILRLSRYQFAPIAPLTLTAPEPALIVSKPEVGLVTVTYLTITMPEPPAPPVAPPPPPPPVFAVPEVPLEALPPVA